MEVLTLETNFSEIMVLPPWVPLITVIYKVMAFAKIPLMTENHLRYKDKR
jgi:hypothetical protein